ncbi:Protein lethal(2)essential for life [Orchesella cincta]|uniref:Protein lethal(2)essential for life n=1 Tax=Orchesella cincta TaxID=48709 RepID=A0A1D2NFP2_ORCCI|nr:Protein lethal(2)essential for life [Orchesella cincta]
MPLRPVTSIWDWDNMLDRSRPSRLFDQHFGIPLDEEQILASSGPAYSIFPYVSSHHYRPRRLVSRNDSTGVSQVDCNRDKFEVKLDVQQFTPEEISVKTVNNNVVIEGKHEEKQDDHGMVFRHFIRKYVLPEDVKPEHVVCNLSSDGVLSITAPRITEAERESVKVIPVIQTGRPAVIREVSREPAADRQGAQPNTTTINIQREDSGAK